MAEFSLASIAPLAADFFKKELELVKPPEGPHPAIECDRCKGKFDLYRMGQEEMRERVRAAFVDIFCQREVGHLEVLKIIRNLPILPERKDGE